jgi:hypothetical protein
MQFYASLFSHTNIQAGTNPGNKLAVYWRWPFKRVKVICINTQHAISDCGRAISAPREENNAALSVSGAFTKCRGGIITIIRHYPCRAPSLNAKAELSLLSSIVRVGRLH